MNKILEVREFDTITGNPDYENNKNYKYLPKSDFENLVDCIHKYSGAEDSADILDFFRVSYKRNVGDIVTIKNYVGLIQMKNGYQIQVLPKISFSDNDDDPGNRNTKKIFLKMLRSMKDFPSKVFTDANLMVDRMNLYEIFINMYLQEVRQLVKYGLKSGYVMQEGNLKYFKGKLLVNQHICANIFHGERFYVAYDEFLQNRAENKLIKATLLKLQKFTESAENSKEIRRLLTSFENIDASINYQKDFSSVSIDRNMAYYDAPLKWSRVFLLNKSFSTFSGDITSRSLLFPMETVFERYVAQQMKKIFSPEGWNVSVQDQKYHLFIEPEAQFALRPDLVLRRDNRTIILDAKWKSLIDNPRKNYGISQNDMYQMFAYSKKYQAPDIWLLYPVNDEMRNHKDIRFNTGDGTTVNLFFVDIANIESSLMELKDKI